MKNGKSKMDPKAVAHVSNYVFKSSIVFAGRLLDPWIFNGLSPRPSTSLFVVHVLFCTRSFALPWFSRFRQAVIRMEPTETVEIVGNRHGNCLFGDDVSILTAAEYAGVMPTGSAQKPEA